MIILVVMKITQDIIMMHRQAIFLRYVWQPTSLRLSCSPDHQPRKDASTHKQLYTDQASLKALQNTAKQERYHKQ